MTVRILVADDHPIIRQGLQLLLDSEPGFKVVAEVGSGSKTVAMIQQAHPDILIVDLMMPDMNGLQVTREVSVFFPQVKTIILSMHQADAYVIEALQNGAKGYVLKEDSSDELIEAIMAVMAGKTYLSTKIDAEKIRTMLGGEDSHPVQDPFDLLTQAEKTFIDLSVRGLPERAIAEQMKCSLAEISRYKARIVDKTGERAWEDVMRKAFG